MDSYSFAPRYNYDIYKHILSLNKLCPHWLEIEHAEIRLLQSRELVSQKISSLEQGSEVPPRQKNKSLMLTECLLAVIQIDPLPDYVLLRVYNLFVNQ